MKIHALPAALVAVLLMSAPALAEDAPAAPKAPKERKICRTDPTLGSIMPRRTCRTKAEWEAIDGANNTNAQNALDRRGPAGGAPGTGF